MFGNWGKDKDVRAHDPADRSAPATAPPDAPAAAGERRLATFDRLGQTLVVTILAATVTGEDAIEITTDIAGRLSGLGGDQPSRHVVLDLQAVQYMDSGCIGAFVELLAALQNAGGRIALVNAGRGVEYLFRLTSLDRLFPICRDVMKAIEAVERAA